MKLPWQKGYKVVHCCWDGKLTSLNGLSRFAYKPGQIRRPSPGCGPLAVFDTLEHALPLAWMCASCLVFECEYCPSKERALWVTRAHTNMHITAGMCPYGTQFASHVRLTQLVLPEVLITALNAHPRPGGLRELGRRYQRSVEYYTKAKGAET